MLGFLGPNGAGKSTTMKMLTGFLEPDAGTRRGSPASTCSTHPNAAKREARLPAGGRAALRRHDARAAFLHFVAAMRGFDGDEADAARRRRGRDAPSSSPCSSSTIETLSKGFKRRVGLAQAILHDPAGADHGRADRRPRSQPEASGAQADRARWPSDKAIIISTHILEEVEAVCTRAVDHQPRPHRRRRHGRGPDAPLAAITTPSRIRVAADQRRCRASALLGESAERVATVETVGAVNGTAQLRALPEHRRAPIATERRRADPRRRRSRSTRCYVERGKLDDVFRQITTLRRREPAMHELVRNTWIIAKREFVAYFATPLASVFLVIFLALTGAFAFFVGGFFERGQADLAPFFHLPPLALPVAGAGGRHAAVGGGAQDRHDRAADDAADLALGGDPRQVPGRLGLHRHGAAADLPDVDHGQLCWAARTTA